MTQTTVRPLPQRIRRSARTALPAGRAARAARRTLAPWLLLAPASIMVLIALGYPLVRQAVMSFQQFGLAQQFGKPEEWVGLSNYVAIVTDPYFWGVFLRSVLFCVWTAGITMLLGVAVSVLMLRLNAVVRAILNTSLVIVWAMPALAALTVWQWLVDPRSGLLNFVLTGVGLEGFKNFNWLGGSPFTFFLIASALITWASLPLVTITIYASLAQVSPEMLEAAQIDGANGFQRVRHIMLPMVFPVISLIAVLQVIWDLRVFTQIYVLQQAGGIASETNLLGTYVYQTGIAHGDYGVASALAMVILALTLVLTARYLRMLYRQGGMA